MSRGIRILVGALLGVVLTAGLLVGVSSVALADATGTGWIGGLVTTSAGKPAAGAVVTLYTIDADQQRTTIVSDVTHSDGKFWLGSQPVGSYYLLVTDPTGDDAGHLVADAVRALPARSVRPHHGQPLPPDHDDARPRHLWQGHLRGQAGR